MATEHKQYSVPEAKEKFVTEKEVRELIAASLANWTGITRFRTVETSIVAITDFTDAIHDHANAAGGGQLNLNSVSTTPLTVPNGGTGVNTITGIIKGNGAGVFTAISPLAGTKQYFVSDSSGGAVTRRLTFQDGVLTSES